MWTSVLQKDLSAQERKKVLKQTCSKVYASQQVRKSTQQNKDALKEILSENPEISIHFIFQHISISECFQYLESRNNNTEQQNALPCLLHNICLKLSPEKDSQFINLLIKQYTKYSSIEKLLIILSIFSEILVKKIPSNLLPVFIPDFIRTSALAIESYMKLRTQAPKFDIDYIEHGATLVKNTQNWVKSSYIQMLSNLAFDFSKQNLNSIKRSVINGVSDVIGALMDIQRQGNIEFHNCQQILSACFNYCNKVTNLKQLSQIYLKQIRQNNFYTRYQKLVVPEYYRADQRINRSGYAYLVYRWVSLANENKIYSAKSIINYLLPAYYQIAMFEYSMKKDILYIFKANLDSLNATNSALQQQQQHLSQFQSGVPLIMIKFILWHHIQKQYPSSKASQQQADSKTSTNSQMYQLITKNSYFDHHGLQKDKQSKSKSTSILNSLILLAQKFHPQGFQNQVNEFIALNVLKNTPDGNEKEQIQAYDQKLFVLIQNLNWEYVNEKGSEMWTSIIEAVKGISQQNQAQLRKSFAQESSNLLGTGQNSNSNNSSNFVKKLLKEKL